MGSKIQHSGRVACSWAVALVSLVMLSDRARSADGGPSPATGPGASEAGAARPTRLEEAPSIRLEANAGQAGPEVLYLARGPRFTAFFVAHGVEMYPARGARAGGVASA